MRYHFLWECVKKGNIIIGYTVTEEQLADLLTKVLGQT
jgi:hypothetical protein